MSRLLVAIQRAHLILEDFLNIWTSKLTTTEDLFAGAFVPFKTKLIISSNLGLAKEYTALLDKFNDLRNKYSHRRKYAIEINTLESLKKLVNNLDCDPPILPCEQFNIYTSGIDQNSQRREITYTWEDADFKKRIVLIFIILVLKFVNWMQREFNQRGVQYKLVVSPVFTTP